MTMSDPPILIPNDKQEEMDYNNPNFNWDSVDESSIIIKEGDPLPIFY